MFATSACIIQLIDICNRLSEIEMNIIRCCLSCMLLLWGRVISHCQRTRTSGKLCTCWRLLHFTNTIQTKKMAWVQEKKLQTTVEGEITSLLITGKIFIELPANRSVIYPRYKTRNWAAHKRLFFARSSNNIQWTKLGQLKAAQNLEKKNWRNETG